MKTLVQTRNSPLKKFNKKRKLDSCSLVVTTESKLLKATDPSRRKRNREVGSTRNKLLKKNSNAGLLNDLSKKRKREEVCGAQSLGLSTKDDRQVNEQLPTQKLKRRRRHKRKKDKVVIDEASQLQRRARYLLIKLKSEQNLIDAYLGEGWKGQSREKIKPEKELLRAKNQILNCKLGIRDIIKQLDLLGSIGQIDKSLIAPDGSVHHEHIICKKCKSQEVSEDNDIILCDGTCNCAFHQKCIDPPLATEDIPPEDEGWLCKYCDCKMEILEGMNAHLGTEFSPDSTWQDIFKEEARLSDVGARDFNEEWPSDESDDNDYDPEGNKSKSCSRSSSEDRGSHEENSYSSLCSLESEVYSESGLSAGRNGVSGHISLVHTNRVTDSNDDEIVSGPRQRSSVDYRKLYDEMFGKDTTTTTTGDIYSEDEDWDPSKKRRKKECDAASTLMTLCESDAKDSQLQNLEGEKNGHPNSIARKPPLRIPSDAVQKLRQAFAENELPSRAAKRKISELLGLEYEKVNKWFKNARYMALKNRKACMQLGKQVPHCSPSVTSESKAEKTADVNLSKCSSSPTATLKMKRLRRVSWNANLITLISSFKKQQIKKTSPGKTKANVEPSDDMCLKKHLLHLKSKIKRKKRVQLDSELHQVQIAEKQMEQLCRLEVKLQKLKRILLTIQKPETNKSDELCLNENVVYVPIAELKEKL